MTKELDEKLCQKYPKIFKGRHGNMKETAMCWGISCSDGWYNIIDILCSNLQWNTDKNNDKGRYPQIVASQVKEKFGGLCFYVESATPEQFAVINFVESMSYHVCEGCGSMDNIGRTIGWATTLCSKCAPTSKYYQTWRLLEDINKEPLP